MVITNKIATTNTAYIVKPGAVALFMKRGVFLETFREQNDATTFHANKHFAPYLYDSSKVVKLGAATLTALTCGAEGIDCQCQGRVCNHWLSHQLSYGGKAMRLPDLMRLCLLRLAIPLNGAGETHAAFATEYVARHFKYAAVNGKYFQAIYVDACRQDSRHRQRGNCLLRLPKVKNIRG